MNNVHYFKNYKMKLWSWFIKNTDKIIVNET